MCRSMVNIQSATAEIRRGKDRTRMWANAQRDGRPVQRSKVWGTPKNFNWFRVLTSDCKLSLPKLNILSSESLLHEYVTHNESHTSIATLVFQC